MEHRDYCSACKARGVPLVKYATNKNKTVQYYHCRDCCNKKSKSYYRNLRGKSRVVESYNRTNERYPEKRKAREAVARAIRNGKIGKPPTCDICKTVGRIEGHHMDYTKPLEVVWLCTACHASYHK